MSSMKEETDSNADCEAKYGKERGDERGSRVMGVYCSSFGRLSRSR